MTKQGILVSTIVAALSMAAILFGATFDELGLGIVNQED